MTDWDFLTSMQWYLAGYTSFTYKSPQMYTAAILLAIWWGVLVWIVKGNQAKRVA